MIFYWVRDFSCGARTTSKVKLLCFVFWGGMFFCVVFCFIFIFFLAEYRVSGSHLGRFETVHYW